MRSVPAKPPFRLPAAPMEAELVAKYFRALGAPTRLAVLALLEDEGELSVGDMVQRLELPQPQLSNHLACLRWCGFVTDRRDFRTVYYRIADERVSQLVGLAGGLLHDNAEHVACCQAIDSPQTLAGD